MGDLRLLVFEENDASIQLQENLICQIFSIAICIVVFFKGWAHFTALVHLFQQLHAGNQNKSIIY